MKKDRTKPFIRKQQFHSAPPDPTPGSALTQVLFDVGRDLRELCATEGLKRLAAMLEADRVQFCGVGRRHAKDLDVHRRDLGCDWMIGKPQASLGRPT